MDHKVQHTLIASCASILLQISAIEELIVITLMIYKYFHASIYMAQVFVKKGRNANLVIKSSTMMRFTNLCKKMRSFYLKPDRNKERLIFLISLKNILNKKKIRGGYKPKHQIMLWSLHNLLCRIIKCLKLKIHCWIWVCFKTKVELFQITLQFIINSL